jgi:hypothetical protein
VSNLTRVRCESFVQEYLANGKNGQNAYMAVFPTCNKITARSAASKLLRRADVKQRIAEFQKKGAERTEITLERLIEEADEIQREAMASKSYAAAVAALIAKAKLAGFLVERFQGSSFNVHYVVGDTPPSEEDWQRQHVTAY